MTTIQDMTRTQRNSWLVLLADGAVFAWFWQKMTVGFSPIPINYDIERFGEIVFGVVFLTIVLHIIISIIFDINSRKSDSGKDERDYIIERRGAFWGYRLLQFGVGCIFVGILMSAAVGEDYQSRILLSSPVDIIFGLMVISYVADLTKHAVMIHGYGR